MTDELTDLVNEYVCAKLMYDSYDSCYAYIERYEAAKDALRHVAINNAPSATTKETPTS